MNEQGIVFDEDTVDRDDQKHYRKTGAPVNGMGSGKSLGESVGYDENTEFVEDNKVERIQTGFNFNYKVNSENVSFKPEDSQGHDEGRRYRKTGFQRPLGGYEPMRHLSTASSVLTSGASDELGASHRYGYHPPDTDSDEAEAYTALGGQSKEERT